MPRIVPRFSNPGVSRYVFKDPKTEEIFYRVPSACIRWPQPFRMRVVRDWISSTKKLTGRAAEAYERYMTMTPFSVQGHGVQFFVKKLDAGTNNGMLCVSTYLYADGHAQALDLYHKKPEVRSLMIFSYLTGEVIGGVPRLRYAKMDFK